MGLTKRTFKTRLAEAEAGDLAAQYDVFSAYLLGEGVESDLDQARAWCRKAAEAGYMQAQLALTDQLSDASEIIHWLTLAAAQGSGDAHTSLAFIHENGQGVPVDLAKARDHYAQALTLKLNIIDPEVVAQKVAQLDRKLRKAAAGEKSPAKKSLAKKKAASTK